MANLDDKKQLAGVIGYFEGEESLLHAMVQVRDAKYHYFDAFTPYPVHGMDAAQGLKRSPLPFVTFAAGLTGCSIGFLLQYWTSAVDWPINVGGKPLNSWPAFIPVIFECTILFAGLATVGAMFILNGLPNIRRKSFSPRLTQDRFAILIEAPIQSESEEKFKPFYEVEVSEFLKKAGAQDIKSVYTEGWF